MASKRKNPVRKHAKKAEKKGIKKSQTTKLVKRRTPTSYDKIKRRHPQASVVLKVLRTTTPARSGYTNIKQFDGPAKYSNIMKNAISKHKLQDKTLSDVTSLMYAGRQTLRDHFTARLEFVSDKGKPMGEAELFGVLAEDVQASFSDLEGLECTSPSSLYYAVAKRCNELQNQGRLASWQCQNTDTGVVAETRMDYTFA